MRVTIGERLGMAKDDRRTAPMGTRSDEAAPHWVEPEKAGPVVNLAACPSAKDVPCRTPGKYCEGCPCAYCKRRTRELDDTDPGPARKRGEMLWLHKTAPVLVIEGGLELSPDEHAAGRRR